MKMRKYRWAVISLLTIIISPLIYSASFGGEYKVDPGHSFVEFRIKHLGFSWLYGRFNKISGEFSYDPEKALASSFSIDIETASVDTNHAERDKHLRGKKGFLEVKKYPIATFRSTKYSGTADRGILEGILTLHGVSRTIEIEIEKVGEGKDPWGGYRAGFIGKTTLARKDFGIDYNLGPFSDLLEFELGIEGILKQ